MTRSISFVNKEGKGRRNEGGVEEETIGVGVGYRSVEVRKREALELKSGLMRIAAFLFDVGHVIMLLSHIH